MTNQVNLDSLISWLRVGSQDRAANQLMAEAADQIERLRKALRRLAQEVVDEDRRTVGPEGPSGELLDLAEKALRGSVHEPSGDRCGAYHPWGQAQCELPKRHPGDHEAYRNTPASAVAWPVVKSSAPL